MEVVVVLRVLWRRRVALVAGFVVALALAVAAGRSSVPSTGEATTRVVFDTSRSQLVTDAPRGADTLPWRSTLAAMLLKTNPTRAQLAAETHIPVAQLAVTDLELTAPSVPASLPRAAIRAANLATEPYVLTVRTDDTLPVVGIQAVAPDRAGAARLAAAAVRALQAGAAPRDTAELQGLSVQEVGPVVAREVPGGSGRKKMAALAVVVFGLWTSALLAGPLLAGMARTVREARVAAH